MVFLFRYGVSFKIGVLTGVSPSKSHMFTQRLSFVCKVTRSVQYDYPPLAVADSLKAIFIMIIAIADHNIVQYRTAYQHHWMSPQSLLRPDLALCSILLNRLTTIAG